MNKKSEIDIVWFKRDLRLQDHAPMLAAVKSTRPVLLLYVFEPSLFNYDHYGERHGRFIWESILDLNAELKRYNAQIHTVFTEVIPALKQIRNEYQIHSLYSHEETGVNMTFERDIMVSEFCDGQGIRWKEWPTNAVFRGLMHRENWRKRWKGRLKGPQLKVDLEELQAVKLSKPLESFFGDHSVPNSFQNPNLKFQQGGVGNAWNYLQDFIAERGRKYNNLISKPAGSRYGCSRLSPYLAWGNLSLKQVYQYLWDEYENVGHQWPLRSFGSRLKWHCHFIQKFESEPRMEFENLNKGYNQIRNKKNEEYIEAWKIGQTGFPMVDACMRAVRETGYINFRMRAMLVSVLTHHLWQPWQAGAQFLGRQFLDLEPGIHYSQFQMQAGTMGVNSVRIYNPVKQGHDHDPKGNFIRQWVPELRNIPLQLVHEPWKMSAMEQQMHSCVIGKTYPKRLVDHKKAYNRANERLWSMKEEQEVKKGNNRILKKHVKNRS